MREEERQELRRVLSNLGLTAAEIERLDDQKLKLLWVDPLVVQRRDMLRAKQLTGDAVLDSLCPKVCSLRELLWQALPAIDYDEREASATVPSPYSGSPHVVEELPLPPELVLPEPALLPVAGPPSLGSGVRSIVSSEAAVQSALDQVLVSCNAPLQVVYGVSWMHSPPLEPLKGVTVQSYAQGVNVRPDFVLGAPVDPFCSFLVAKRVEVLEAAGVASLAQAWNDNNAHVRSTISQAYACAASFGVRYGVVSTYKVTWLLSFEEGGDLLRVSRGLPFDGRDPTVLQALWWLSSQAAGGRVAFRRWPPPARPAPSTPSGDGDAALVSLPAGLVLAAASADTARAAGKGDGGGGSSGAADASGTSAKVVDIEELPDPEFLMGRGLTGNIFATTWRGRPVAVKATVDPALLPLLRNEVSVYEWPTVRPLQGTLLPELVGWGAADSPPSAWLLTALVEGGVPLDPEVHPEHRCPAVEAAAAEALAALHAAGFLHGDVRADNLLVVPQPGPGGLATAHGSGPQPPPNRPAAQPDGGGPPPPPRVVLIDLGLARPMPAGGEGRDAAQAELADLRALFRPAASHGLDDGPTSADVGPAPTRQDADPPPFSACAGRRRLMGVRLQQPDAGWLQGRRQLGPPAPAPGRTALLGHRRRGSLPSGAVGRGVQRLLVFA